MRLAIIAALHCMLAPGWAWAQTGAPPTPPPASQVIERVQARYRGGPTCERLSFEVRTDSGRVARSWAIVRMAPAEGDKAGPRLLLELGALRIAADGRELSAVHERNPQTCFVAEIDGQGPLTSARLRKVLPPVPMFQLDLFDAADPDRVAEFTPYARSIQWNAVAVDPRNPNRMTITGTANVGRVSMVVRNDQVQSIEVRDDLRAVTLRVQVSPVAPCRESDLRMDIAARTRVARLGDLQPRAGVLRVGSPVPEMQLSTAAGQVQRLVDLFTPPSEFLPAPEVELLVLIFTRRDKPDWRVPKRLGRVELPDLGREMRNLQRDAYALVRTGQASPTDASGRAGGAETDRTEPLLATFNFAQVMVLESPPAAEDLLGLIKAERRMWGAGAGDGDEGGSGEHLAWSTDPKASVDLFSPAGESVAIVLDVNLKLRQVFVVGEHMTTEQLLDQITAALIDTGAEPR